MLKKVVWGIGAIFSGFAGLATIASWLAIKPDSLLGWVLSPFVALENWLSNTHLIYGWIIVLMSIAVIAIVIQISNQLLSRPPDQPKYKQYVSDVVDGVKCSWRWDSFGNPDDVRYFCTACEGELGYTKQSSHLAVPRTGLGCYNCQKLLAEFDGDTDFVDERILSEIDRRARVDHGKPTH